MRTHPWIGLLLLLLAWLPALGKDAKIDDLLDHLPQDPLLVTVMNGENLAETFDELLDLAGRFAEDGAGDEIGVKLAAFDAEIGCSVRDDLMGAIGPQFAFVFDLPPVDSLAAAMSAPAEAVPLALGKIGLLAAVGSREKFDACLRKLFTLDDRARIEEEDDVSRVRFALDEAEISLYFAYREDWFAFGATADNVRALLGTRAKGERLRDGTDFARVFSQLDAEPQRAFYVNLPKLREMISSSMMIKALGGTRPEAQGMIEMFLAPDFTPTGIGSTAVQTDGGTRTTTFGPEGLSGGSAMLGVAAAVAVPNLLNAIDRGKQKRTMSDIGSAAIACEAYSGDNDGYPSSEGSWVPLSQIEGMLSPVYIRELPVEDGWGHPLMYRSDGKHFLLASPGKDGEHSQEWTVDSEGGETSSFDGDIVFADGTYLSWPADAGE